MSRHTNSNIKTLTYPKECNPIIFNESTLFGRIDCVVVGSEFDAVVASQYLEIPTVGLPEAHTFKHEWGEYLSDMDTIYVCLPEEMAKSSDALEELISQCPNSTIMDISLPKGIGSVAEFFSIGGTEKDLFEDLYLLYGESPVGSEDIKEMSLDELADILDSTIKSDRRVKTILFLAFY